MNQTETQCGSASTLLKAGRELAVIALFAGIAAICYSGVTGHDFVNLDDPQNFIENDEYRGFGWTQLKWMLTSFHAGHWHPLTWLSLAFDHWRSGGGELPKAPPVKVTNVLLHIANAYLVYRLAIRLRLLPQSKAGCYTIANLSATGILAGLFFLVHPQRAESVAWATERRDVLSTFFLLLSLLAFLRSADISNRRWLALRLGSLICFGCSLLSKAWGITFPVVLLILIVYWRQRVSREQQFSGQYSQPGYRSLIAYAVLAFPVALLALAAQQEHGALSTTELYGFELRFLQMLVSFAWYPWTALVPIDLHPAHLVQLDLGWTSGVVWLSASVVAGVIFVAWRWRESNPSLLAVVCTYLVLILPVSGIAQSGFQLVADRYGYVALIPLWILIGCSLAALWQRSRQWQYGGFARLMMATGLSALLALGIVATKRQAEKWRDSITLWNHVLDIDPDNEVALINRAGYWVKIDKLDSAIDDYSAAVAAANRSGANKVKTLAGNNLGSVLELANRPEEAAAAYRAVLKAFPRDPKATVALMRLQPDSQSPAERIQSLRRAVAANPNDPEVIGQLGQELLLAGLVKEAAPKLELAVELSEDGPSSATHLYNLGLCRQHQQRPVEAEKLYLLSIERDGTRASAFNQLGVLYLQSNKLGQAVTCFSKTFELEPGHINSRFNLGMAYLRMGKLDDARSAFTSVTQLAEEGTPAHRAATNRLEQLE